MVDPQVTVLAATVSGTNALKAFVLCSDQDLALDLMQALSGRGLDLEYQVIAPDTGLDLSLYSV
jgi:hypothetical protein